MAQANGTGYTRLIGRLNRYPQGAPSSDLLYQILKVLFSEREAELTAQLPIKPFTAEQAARIWQMNRTEAQHVLDELADRAILLDVERDGEAVYLLPPPMAGFFEFSLMRMRDDIDQALLAELFYQYCTVDDTFMADLVRTETLPGRIFVNESVLPELHVLDYERASQVIKTASHIGVSLCFCRHKMQHTAEACDAPLEICLTFNLTARSLIKHEFARQVDVAEGLDLLQQAYAHNLVQFGENVREQVNFICNCCGCCCEAMISARRFSLGRTLHTNYLPVIQAEDCTGCGKCVDVCPVEAMTLVSAHDPNRLRHRQASLNEDICLGCGVCVRNCPTGAIRLEPRPERVVTPANTMHRSVMMAIEKGMLQHLIFDNHVLWSHRALAGLLGVILKLPPLKQAMASQQMKSRYLDTLLANYRL